MHDPQTVKDQVKAALHDRFGIDHATVETR